MFTVELLPAFQLDELDEERQAKHLSPELLDKLARGARRTASRQQIVDDQNALSRVHRVVMDFERVGPVLEIVRRPRRFRRQLARLPNERKTCTDAVGDGRPEDKPAALDADDQVDLLLCERQNEVVD